MTRVLAALILSTAAIGGAQAAELGYADNPGHNNEYTSSRGDVRSDMRTDRAQVQGQAASQANTRNASETREETIREQRAARPTNAAGVTFVNG